MTEQEMKVYVNNIVQTMKCDLDENDVVDEFDIGIYCNCLYDLGIPKILTDITEYFNKFNLNENELRIKVIVEQIWYTISSFYDSKYSIENEVLSLCALLDLLKESNMSGIKNSILKKINLLINYIDLILIDYYENRPKKNVISLK